MSVALNLLEVYCKLFREYGKEHAGKSSIEAANILERSMAFCASTVFLILSIGDKDSQ
jgi:hypothetical protein